MIEIVIHLLRLLIAQHNSTYALSLHKLMRWKLHKRTHSHVCLLKIHQFCPANQEVTQPLEYLLLCLLGPPNL